MIFIAVDDERPALFMIERAILSAAPYAEVACFDSVADALDYARNSTVDVAFLDIHMDEMNGLLLARELKSIRGDTNIIFVTGYSEYALDAFELSASGYVMKPINPEHVAREIANLRYPVAREDKGIRVQCFGNFEVFFDGKPIIFSRPKSKEALAYLIDRKGASVSKKELAAVLWEDKPYTRSLQSHLHILISEITRSLTEAGAKDLIVRKKGFYSVDTSVFACDYYGYEKGDITAVNSYRGEYMSNYSWAEFTAGTLDKR